MTDLGYNYDVPECPGWWWYRRSDCHGIAGDVFEVVINVVGEIKIMVDGELCELGRGSPHLYAGPLEEPPVPNQSDAGGITTTQGAKRKIEL